MRSIVSKNVHTFEFSGEMDNLRISHLKNVVIQLIDQYKCPVVQFDFKDVTFIDSTGIGFILARYNQINAYKGELILKNVTPFVRKILAISGIFQIMKVENDDLRNGVLR
ncbi:MAG: STAS domain-containing protein [Erysipelotrichaceae bacterium]|nr:STAS domain-containing protein [Erysipelotrichaceae bacterium]MBQ7889640.1 STAS domain-containing protein [Erysipelotrichaceae bacterium]